jgi:hypothetical protein
MVGRLIDVATALAAIAIPIFADSFRAALALWTGLGLLYIALRGSHHLRGLPDRKGL